MTTALAHAEDQRLARPLKVLVPLIKDDLQHGKEAAERAGLPYYQAAGEKMLEAKEQLKHGEFTDWVKRNFNLSMTSAQNYMNLARAMSEQKPRALGFSNLQQFVEPEPRSRISAPAWHEPVKQIVSEIDTETLNLKREELKRQEERDAQKALALQLIDIGYKVLARELHPDKGGSREAMARLNAVRDRLKQSA